MFYKNLAPVYQYVFPVMEKGNFLFNHFKNNKVILDVGCSDGRVALALAEKDLNYEIIGIDLSQDLIEVAKDVTKNNSHVSIRNMNMLDVGQDYSTNYFDGIYCIGNTIVHLNDEKEITEALTSFNRVMKVDGRLIIQILNYDLILRDQIKELPLIDNENVRFEREYNFIDAQHMQFNASLTLKKDGEQRLTANTMLYPITKDSLERCLHISGFEDLVWYSDFKASNYDPEKLTLIVVATKKVSK